ATSRNPPMRAFFIALFGAGLYCFITQLTFNAGKVIGFVYPVFALIVSAVGSLALHYVMAAFERERTRDVFSRFVPEQVVDQVLARTDSDLRLGGVRVETTVMFSDLRGFTTASENMPPEQVIEVLNVYLSEMTEAILAHCGTLASFMGDWIM